MQFVIFHGGAYSFISYYQGAERGGGAGLHCDVFTILDSQKMTGRKGDGDGDVSTVHEWNEFTLTRKCWVASIAACFDITCAGIPGQQECNNCSHSEDDLHIMACKVIKGEVG